MSPVTFFLLLCAAQDSSYYVDNRSLVLLLSGMCHKYLGNMTAAEKSLQEVISCEKDIVVDHYLIPYATYELGILYWSKNDLSLATMTLENAK